MAATTQVTLLLQRVSRGDQSAEQELFSAIYPDLHRVAESLMRRERRDHTLGPTALVHEAYIRLAAAQGDWNSRVHFFAVASAVMRKILVDHARKHKSGKRGAGAVKLELTDHFPSSDEDLANVIAIDEALTRLAQRNERLAKVAEMRYFGGLTEEEIGLLLDVSARTIKRDWAEAKELLGADLCDARGTSGT